MLGAALKLGLPNRRKSVGNVHIMSAPFCGSWGNLFRFTKPHPENPTFTTGIWPFSRSTHLSTAESEVPPLGLLCCDIHRNTQHKKTIRSMNPAEKGGRGLLQSQRLMTYHHVEARHPGHRGNEHADQQQAGRWPLSYKHRRGASCAARVRWSAYESSTERRKRADDVTHQ